MFVMCASFEINKEHSEDILVNKAKHTEAEAKKAAGFISFECWRKEHKETIEYALVSKWENESFFKQWISREEHALEHRQMQAARRTQEPESMIQMKKTLRSFEMKNLESLA